MSEYLPLAIRAFTERCGRKQRRPSRRASRTWRRPQLLLVLDTETTTDCAQTLKFGCVHVYRLDAAGLQLIEEILFHADDLGNVDSLGFERLRSYCARRQLRLLSRREFVNTVLWRIGYQARAWIVGFNLPFDLSRLAVSWGAARSTGRGGFSLALWDYESDGARREQRYRPRINVLTIDSKRALIRFRKRRDPDSVDLIPEDSQDGRPDPSYVFPGQFLDLRSLTFALTNEAHTLASACEEFGVPHGKLAVDQHGEITERYIDYCRRDVLATAGLFERLLAQYQRHPIALSPTRARSPAGLAKAYLDVMNITPFLETNGQLPRELLGHAMSAYVGGRTECRLRRTPMPVVYVDFLSMYPTVNALIGLWSFFVADRIVTADATEDVRRLLAETELDDCFKPELWQELPVLCLVEPHGEILPARCAYASGSNWQIGVNPLTSRKPLWFPLADVLAAKLLAGRAPHILEAVRFVALGMQAGLQPVRLRGEIEIDPTRHDFFRRCIEERKRLERRPDVDKAERARLGELLKVTANSGSYGITAEMTRQELGARSEEVMVFAVNEGFKQRISAVEEPGRYCFPPLAACITGAARLMLAMLERCVTDLGGTYVFCDTDSMAIVATQEGGTPREKGSGQASGDDELQTLSFRQVDAIADRFGALSPYDPDVVPGSILKVETINYESGRQRQVHAYAISAKRYCIYTINAEGHVQIIKGSEHGLGHLLNPIDPDRSDRDWIRQIWHLLACDAHGLRTREPAWLDRPALSKTPVTSPQVLRPFTQYNELRSPDQQIRPYNFLLHAQVAPFGFPPNSEPAKFRLVASYESDPRRWSDLEWINLYDGLTYAVSFSGDPSPSVVRLKTYRDVVGLYQTHPEPKSLGADGKPCSRSTKGLLLRRPVKMSTLNLIGKESNNLEARTAGLIANLDDVLNTYNDPNLDFWSELVVSVLQDTSTTVIARRSGLDPRTIQRVRSGRSSPHPRHRAALALLAGDIAAERLAAHDQNIPDELGARLAAYRDALPELGRKCAMCGKPHQRHRAKYCGEACRKRAYRKRRAT